MPLVLECSAFCQVDTDLSDLRSSDGDYDLLQTVDLPEKVCEDSLQATPPHSADSVTRRMLPKDMYIYTIHEAEEEQCTLNSAEGQQSASCDTFS